MSIAVGTERPAAGSYTGVAGPGQGREVAAAPLPATRRPVARSALAAGPGQGECYRAPLPDPIDHDIADLERKIRAFREAKP